MHGKLIFSRFVSIEGDKSTLGKMINMKYFNKMRINYKDVIKFILGVAACVLLISGGRDSEWYNLMFCFIGGGLIGVLVKPKAYNLD